MALRNIFRKKKPKEELLKPAEKPKEEISLRKPSKVKSSKVRKEVKTGEARQVLKSPHVTEKATGLAGQNKYVFKVGSRAKKIEIKKAIQDIYDVEVLDVRTINIPRKLRKLGRQKGWRGGYKKAIVKIKEGQKIEVLPR